MNRNFGVVYLKWCRIRDKYQNFFLKKLLKTIGREVMKLVAKHIFFRIALMYPWDGGKKVGNVTVKVHNFSEIANIELFLKRTIDTFF